MEDMEEDITEDIATAPVIEALTGLVKAVAPAAAIHILKAHCVTNLKLKPLMNFLNIIMKIIN